MLEAPMSELEAGSNNLTAISISILYLINAQLMQVI